MNRTFLPRPGRPVLLVIGILILASLACGPLAQPTPTPTPPPTETPLPTNTPEPTATPEPTLKPQPVGAASLDIVNQTDTTICYVYISPTTDTEWGPDQLGASDTIPPGGIFTINDIPLGIYDLKTEDCSNEVLSINLEVDMTVVDVYTLTVSLTTTELVVINNSSFELCYLYVSPTDATDWGPDQFDPNQTLRPGGTHTLTGIPPGRYDLRIEACSGEYVEFYDADLTSDFEWTITD